MTPAPPITTWRFGLVCAMISFFAGLCMVSSESLWIDEGQTFRFARQPTFAAWFHELTHSFKSEAQMPLGMLAAWVGGKTVGLSEWQLRAPNLIWVALAGLAIGWTGRLLRQPLLLLIFLVNPFLWFYVNEARPYALQICAGAWMLYVLACAHARGTVSTRALWILLGATVAGFGSSLLFGFAIAGVAVAGFLLWRQGKLRQRWTTGHLLPVVLMVLILAGLAAYYLHTLRRGASGAKMWTVSPLNLAFALYEMLGFSGFGPPRNELRELVRQPRELLHALLRPVPLLGLGGLSIVYALVAMRLGRMWRDPLARWLGVSLIAAAGALYGAAVVVRFPFWGRHLAPLLPFLVTLVVVALCRPAAAGATVAAWNRYSSPLALTFLLLASSLLLRFSPAHRKDDYRTACRLALRALTEKRVVWWCADAEECAEYYGLTQRRATELGGQLIPCFVPKVEQADRWPPPDVLVVSKPDIHDPTRVLRIYRDRYQLRTLCQLPAFVVSIGRDPALERLMDAN